ncbi:DoxX family membrane protein [Nocardia sp. NPDC127579]|uniref:DoxX family protein n=1 Tax=Nocardia sp. NPDC127579 TaxID=3345402 RepID=UPI00363391FA
MLLRRLARPLLATTFIVDGVDTLIHPAPRAKTAAALVQRGERTLPDRYAAKLPADPGVFVRVNAFAQVSAGALLALGKAPRLASLVLAATVVPATVTEQNFWDEPDPDRKAAKRAAFLKDVSLLGGLMIAAADTAGKPSLGWRGRKAASAAAAALPFTGGADPQTAEVLRERAHDAALRAQRFGAIAAAKGGEFAETAQHRGAEFAEIAQHRGAELAELARQRGPELAERAQHRGAELADLARQRGPELAERARRRGPELAERARQRGPELAEVARRRGPELAERARHHAPELAASAREHGSEWAEYAREHGSEWADLARKRGIEFAELARVRAAELAETARERAESRRR